MAKTVTRTDAPGEILILTREPEAFPSLSSHVVRTDAHDSHGRERALQGDWGLILVDSEFAEGRGEQLAMELAAAGGEVLLISRAPSLDQTLRARAGGVREVLGFPPSGEMILDRLGTRAGTDGSEEWAAAGEEDVVGRDESMLEIFRAVSRIARGSSNFLVQGEPGVGKAMLLRSLHRFSGRAEAALVELNCGALPEDLLESELFGHEPDTFPWAIASRRGRLERAHQGTLLLHHVDRLPPRLQVSLLPVLREGTVERVGGGRTIQADVRILTTSTKELHVEVAAGRFLEDLYHVLAPVSVTVPPLRDRRDDIVLLARHFTASAARRYGSDVADISLEAQSHLRELEWPGNVRQLKYVVDRAVVITDGPKMERRHAEKAYASLSGHEGRTRTVPGEPSALQQTAPHADSAGRSLDEVEAAHIEKVLRTTDGNHSRAADILGIHRNTLRRKVRTYGIDV